MSQNKSGLEMPKTLLESAKSRLEVDSQQGTYRSREKMKNVYVTPKNEENMKRIYEFAEVIEIPKEWL